MKIALIFWGLTRSLRYTIDSIDKNILQILKNNNIEYDIYLHTYFMNADKSKSGLIFDEYILLNPKYLLIDNQDEIDKLLNLNEYFPQKDPWDNNYKSVYNFVRALYSKYRITKLFEKNMHKYDYVIYLRPDVKYLNELNPKIFDLIVDNESGLIADFHHWGGYNDRMFISKPKLALYYGTLYDKLLDYSKLKSNNSETFNKDMLERFNIKFVNVYFNRIRENGNEEMDYEDEYIRKKATCSTLILFFILIVWLLLIW